MSKEGGPKDPKIIVKSQWQNLVITSPGETPEAKKREAAQQMKKIYSGIGNVVRDSEGKIKLVGASLNDITAHDLLEKEGLLDEV